MSVCRARDYSAPVNFISAGLKKGAAEEADSEDSDAEEKPAKQEDFPKDLGPKKLKTVGLLGQSPGGTPWRSQCSGFLHREKPGEHLCMCCPLGPAVPFLLRVTDVVVVQMLLFTMQCSCRLELPPLGCSVFLSHPNSSLLLCRVVILSPARKALQEEPSPSWTLAAGRDTRKGSGRSCCRRWAMSLGVAWERMHRVSVVEGRLVLPASSL